MQKIARGIVCWDGEERRSDRYGAIALQDEAFNGDHTQLEVTFDSKTAQLFKFKKVRMAAKVLEARKSGHLGDLAHKIFPTTPDVGETVDLGIGYLDLEVCPYDPKTTCLLLRPEDGRARFWFDPYKLYRLHDQTVDLFIEETTEKCTPMVDIPPPKEGMISNGDGSFQAKGFTPTDAIKLRPAIRRLGDGMFMLEDPAKAPAGEYIEMIPEDDPK